MRSLHAALLATLLAAIAGVDSAATQRQRRESPPQRHVERTIDYFTGTWRVEYIGAELPPLSPGSRSGTITFAKQAASAFVAGQFEGDVNGKMYRETQTIGLDAESYALVAVE